jgi:glycine reductase
MDLESQEAISRLAEENDPSELLVLIGAPDPEAAEITAETVRLGDPAYAGALAGVQLGLDVYHIMEEPVREDVPDDVWEEQIGVMSDVLDVDELVEAVSKMRAQEPDSDGSDSGSDSSSDSDSDSEKDSDSD